MSTFTWSAIPGCEMPLIYSILTFVFTDSSVHQDYPTLSSTNKPTVTSSSNFNHDTNLPLSSKMPKSMKKAKKTGDGNSSESDSNKRKKKGSNNDSMNTHFSNNSNSGQNNENVEPNLSKFCGARNENCRNNGPASNSERIEEDFPPLGSTNATSIPPPGFNTTVSHKVTPIPPGFKSTVPPGFSNRNNEVPAVTFTSSCGQDYALPTSE